MHAECGRPTKPSLRGTEKGRRRRSGGGKEHKCRQPSNHPLAHSVCDFLLILFCTWLCVCVCQCEYRARFPAPTRALSYRKINVFRVLLHILWLGANAVRTNLCAKIDAISRRILFTILYYILFCFSRAFAFVQCLTVGVPAIFAVGEKEFKMLACVQQQL